MREGTAHISTMGKPPVSEHSRMHPKIGSGDSGYTLVELMITVAIISIITAIAIPVYEGYIAEARLGAARANADSLRLFMEEFNLNNGTYQANNTNAGAGCTAAGGNYTQHGATTELEDCFGWRPDGDNDLFTYSVVADASSWSVVVEHTNGDWIRCERRMRNCCDSDTSGATKNSCP